MFFTIDYMILFFLALLFVALITFLITKRKMENLFVLDKRQQGYINQLINYDTRLAILQRLFFYIVLILCKETKQFGIRQLKNHFVIDDEIINDQEKLINFFLKILNYRQRLQVQLKNGKYFFVNL